MRRLGLGRFVAGLAMLLGSAGAWGQGSVPVTVVVRDPSGAAVPRARVEITPDSGAAAVTILSSDAGGKLQTTLDPGGYDLQISAPGLLKKDKAVTVSGPMKIAVTLAVGGTADPEITVENPTRALVTEVSPDAGQTDTGAPAAKASVLVIEAGPGERGVFTAASLREYPQTKVTVFDHHANKNVTYEGVPLMELLAHLGVPHGKNLMGKPLQEYVVATGSDGYSTVLSLGEVDPDFHPGMVLVADELDGKPLGAKTGPFRLVVSEDRNATRSVWGLVKIEVRKAE